MQPTQGGGYMQQQQQQKQHPSHVPMMPAEDQTMMWAQQTQQSYYVDSGIHSGIQTHAATSIISGMSGPNSSMMDEYSDPYTPGYTQEQVEGTSRDKLQFSWPTVDSNPCFGWFIDFFFLI